ncbi:MAG: hypothetical protein HZA46_19965 [Planctomycetales bacterium]|nr:hypothetical protein [Planctomycetales bacterium]
MSIVLVLVTIPVQAATPIELGSRRELFVDHHLIEKVDGCRLELARPRDEGVVLKFDQPWEGQFCGYCTVIKDGDRFRVYYRGNPTVGRDGSNTEVTCVAESPDGIAWTKPKLGHFDVHGTKDNNVVLAGLAPFSHNFSPLLDSRPGVPADERWKAIGGTMSSGLAAFASSDGLRWRKLRDEPILTKVTVPYKYMFDSQNLAFWSESERKYVCFFRVFQDGIRRIARSTSDDFLTWSEPVLMEYRREGGSVPVEHHYTSQTHAYFRAPHIYVSLAARFMPGRQVLTDDEAKVIGVNAGYFKDTSDAIFQTSRGGGVYDRTFLEGFLRPGLGPRNWVSRTNYPALNVVQTGPDEMSFYVNQDYAQPTAHLHRYSLRLDGFASVRAGYSAGELLTKPITFTGKRLLVNLATSAAGSLRVEVQDAAGKPIPGFALDEARELIGNEIERPVSWKSGSDVSKLAGHAIRLRLVLKDADLFALRFAE